VQLQLGRCCKHRLDNPQQRPVVWSWSARITGSETLSVVANWVCWSSIKWWHLSTEQVIG
jgi:hypothetical protein